MNRCWLLFPWRHSNWKEKAVPAQKAYAHVANAIQQHGAEQVTVGVRKEDWATARALLDPHVCNYVHVYSHYAQPTNHLSVCLLIGPYRGISL